MDENKGNIIIYQSEDGNIRLDVRLEDKTVWLTQQQMAELYGSSRTNVVEHIKHIYEEGELQENATCRKFRQVRQEGNREVAREIPYYNLDMIISLGYRVRSITATRFRQWATERLHEYIVKGFALDDERLKNLGGGSYWKELLDRIRDIRSSEKVLYRQVLDLYATAVDYDPRSDTSRLFFNSLRAASSALRRTRQLRESAVTAHRRGHRNPLPAFCLRHLLLTWRVCFPRLPN